MAGITNNELLKNMAVDIAIIKKAIEPLPDMFKDIYVGNGDPPIRDTCRDYLAEKKKEKEIEKEKKDNKQWFNRLVIGAIVAQTAGLIFALVK